MSIETQLFEAINANDVSTAKRCLAVIIREELGSYGSIQTNKAGWIDVGDGIVRAYRKDDYGRVLRSAQTIVARELPCEGYSVGKYSLPNVRRADSEGGEAGKILHESRPGLP